MNRKQNYLSYLKSGDWCLNDKVYASETDNTTALTSQEILDKQIKGEEFYYDSYVRLEGKTIKEPTLKCNGTNMMKFGDNTNMYVGTLTADEIIYSGAVFKIKNKGFYLMNESLNYLDFWTLSPYMAYRTSNSIVFFGISGILNGPPVDHNNVSFRPSINLKSSIQISNGNGTKKNPYTVKLS